MKFSEMNAREKRAYLNIKHAANWLIGDWENTMLDWDKDSDEYKSAAATLANHDELVGLIYREATTSLYDDGCFAWGPYAEKALKDIRFCGKAWLMERVERYVTKLGY